jgi:DHA1 family bicyclomycin/chloramphenicol resistance-like MFS transporter
VFGFMALFGVSLAVGTHFTLTETHPREKRVPLHAVTLAQTAWSIMRHREFLLLATAMGANFATLMCFVGAAPAVVIDHWHLSETQFANLFFPAIGGLVSSAIISGHMAGRFTYAQQSRLGFMLALGGSGLMTVLWAVSDAPSLLIQQLIIAVVAFGVQLAGPTLSLRMLDLFPLARGSAASVQSCVSIAVSALVFGGISPLLSGSMLWLAEGSFCCALAAFGLWRLSQRGLPAASKSTVAS